MDQKPKTLTLFARVAFAIAMLSFTLFCGLLLLVTMTSSVSGTASLPNGTTAIINGPFSCASNTLTTEIEAGGHLFAFSPTKISVDGVTIGPLDESITAVEIDSNYWTATLRLNGTEVPIRR
ncbi:MAG: hypothetical protein KDB03_25025 [Planctomycetales bacterium]|nr:hypothetical protein [Planctomycetales bacterium]